MQNTNVVLIVGRLTADPKISITSAGQKKTNYAIAVNEYTKKGEPEKVSFFDVEAWGAQVDVIEKYLAKGKKILIRGRIQQQRWEKDGQKRSRVMIQQEGMEFLDAPKTANDDDKYNLGNMPKNVDSVSDQQEFDF